MRWIVNSLNPLKASNQYVRFLRKSVQPLDHVSISVGCLAECVGFYDAIMQALGCEKIYQTDSSLGYGVRCHAGEENHSCLAVYESEQANTDDKRHWCFKANSQEMVDRFYEAGISNGGASNGEPGIRSGAKGARFD